MRELKTLTFVKSLVDVYNPEYTHLYFEDENSNQYIWVVSYKTKEWESNFNYKIGDVVKLRATVEGNRLKRVRIVK